MQTRSRLERYQGLYSNNQNTRNEESGNNTNFVNGNINNIYQQPTRSRSTLNAYQENTARYNEMIKEHEEFLNQMEEKYPQFNQTLNTSYQQPSTRINNANQQATNPFAQQPQTNPFVQQPINNQNPFVQQPINNQYQQPQNPYQQYQTQNPFVQPKVDDNTVSLNMESVRMERQEEKITFNEPKSYPNERAIDDVFGENYPFDDASIDPAFARNVQQASDGQPQDERINIYTEDNLEDFFNEVVNNSKVDEEETSQPNVETKPEAAQTQTIKPTPVNNENKLNVVNIPKINDDAVENDNIFVEVTVDSQTKAPINYQPKKDDFDARTYDSNLLQGKDITPIIQQVKQEQKVQPEIINQPNKNDFEVNTIENILLKNKVVTPVEERVDTPTIRITQPNESVKSTITPVYSNEKVDSIAQEIKQYTLSNKNLSRQVKDYENIEGDFDDITRILNEVKSYTQPIPVVKDTYDVEKTEAKIEPTLSEIIRQNEVKEEVQPESIVELTQRIEQERVMREELLEKTRQLNLQIDEYENVVDDLHTNMNKTGKILNVLITILVITLFVIIIIIGYWFFQERGLI